MSQEARAALSREIGDAGRGLGRLLRYDPAWPEGFDFSAVGFLRSFFGPALALPFYIVFVAMIATEGVSEPLTATPLWEAAVGHVLGAAGFPLVVAALARPFRFVDGYIAFIVLTNWATLFVTVALTLASPLTMLGDAGLAMLGFVQLVLFAVVIFLTWRASRETLSPDAAPAMLMVVLNVAVGVAAGQAADLLVKLF